jgi:predicted nucleotide-binding protein
MPREHFTVAIMHGRSKEYLKIKKLVKDKQFQAAVLMEEFGGKVILDNLKGVIWDRAHCAVIVMSPDDKLESGYRARQNVIFELGYCIAAFDSIKRKYRYPAVIIVKEQSVEKFADIDGLQYIAYTREISTTVLRKIGKALEQTFERAAEFYVDDLGDDDEEE